MKPPLTYRSNSTSPNIGGYRHFFNGQEGDNEVFGDGMGLSAEFWQYDTRLCRRWNLDPVFKEYESPYACFAGNPVWLKDPLGKSSWKPDSGAFAQNNEVRFIAEADDNLQTLSIQSGISLEQLEDNYRGLNIVEGQSYSFDKITPIKLMNDFLQNHNNTEYNCMFFAMYVNGVPSPPFSVLPEMILNNFTNLSSPSEAKIGNIITYSETFDEFYFHYRGEAVSYTDETFKDYYNAQMKNYPAHFSVVLLKNISGDDVKYIIQKSGKNPVSFGLYPVQPKNYEDNRNGIMLFEPNPINKNDKTPIYTRQ